jgi:hypothetical protein
MLSRSVLDRRHGDQAEDQRADGGADQDERHAAADGRAQAVGPGTDGRLDEDRRNVVEGHEKANQDRRETELVGEEKRHEGVVHRPDHTDAEETEPEQEDLAVIEFHVASPLCI